MKYLLLAIAFVASGLTEASASCYVKGFVGVDWLSSYSDGYATLDFNLGPVAALGVGVESCENDCTLSSLLRGDLEINYRQNNIHKVSNEWYGAKPNTLSHTAALIGTVYIDIPTPYCFQPYAGIGLGYALKHMETKSGYITSVKWAHKMASQYSVGIRRPFCQRASLGLEYRYFTAGSDCRHHNIGLSLIY